MNSKMRTLKVFCLALGVLISQSSFSKAQTNNDDNRYDALKVQEYSKLSKQDQKYFKDKLISRLKKDPDFLEYNSRLVSSANSYLEHGPKSPAADSLKLIKN